MRRVRLGFVLSTIIALPAVGVTQWLRHPTADVPRNGDGGPNLTAPAPRLADGKPDFSAIWHVALRNPCNPAVNRLSACTEIGGSPLARNIGASLPGGLPFQPWAAEITRQRTAATAATIHMCGACRTIHRVTGDCRTSINSCTPQSCWSCCTR